MKRSLFQRVISTMLGTSLVFSQLTGIALAATIPANKIDLTSNGFALSGAYSTVSNQPTGAGAFGNGQLGAYVEGACIPVLVTAKNKSNNTGDITLELVYDYHHSGAVTGEIGIDHLNALTLTSGSDPALADNLNDFGFSGSDITTVTSFTTASGTSVAATVTGPYANNSGTTAVSSTDDDRHYNVTLQNVPSGQTVNVLVCAQLGPDASEFPGASLKISAGNGSGGNISINVGSLLALPSLTISKVVSTGTALPSDFSFTVSPSINGVSSYSIASGQSSVTIDNIPTDGNYTVTENGLTGYRFASGSGTSCNFTGETGTATVAAGNPATNATCTFTNEEIPVTTLTADIVVVNDNGGTLLSSAIQPMIDSVNVVDGVANVVTVGAHNVSINPTSVTGYTVAFSGACDASGDVMLVEGDAAVCTITFDDQAATINVIKQVVNNTTGSNVSGDFSLVVTNNSVALPSVAGSQTGVPVTVNAGSYSVDEADSMGYIADYSADCAGTIALGETKTCTITNTDEIITPPETGTVHVEVVVTSDNGGALDESNVLVNVSADTPNPASFLGDTAPRDVVMGVGDYDVTSNALTGYSVSYSADCTGSITKDETKTCTITYDDLPASLSVIVNVVNDFNGQAASNDFGVTVSGTNPNPSAFAGDSVGTVVAIDAGSYGVSLDADLRYDYAYSTDCNGTMSNGGNLTCTITATAKPARLVIKKNLIVDSNTQFNDAEDDFTMYISSASSSVSSVSGDADGIEVLLDRGTYTVTEDDNDGIVPQRYTISYANCDGDIDNGETITCTVTNNDRGSNGGGGGGGSQNGQLNVLVVVNNSNTGGILVEDTQYNVETSQTDQTYTGAATQSHSLPDGTYTVTAVDEVGYTVTLTGECSGTSAQNMSYTCTVTYTKQNSGGSGNGGGGGGGIPATGGSTPVTPGVVLGDTDEIDVCAEAEQEAKDLAGYADRLTLAGTPLAAVVFKALTTKLLAKIMPTETEQLAKTSISNFIENGSKSTKHLGEGERAGVINSFKSIYGHYPETGCDWQNVIQMSREQKAKDLNASRESSKKELFTQVYKRQATNTSADEKALVYMTYGMRPMSRDLRKEDATNQLFLKLYGHYPQTADEWDLMRAMAYGLQVGN